nr:MAG TPA: hypothetical protein [Caudoviricetes sp.]
MLCISLRAYPLWSNSFLISANMVSHAFYT